MQGGGGGGLSSSTVDCVRGRFRGRMLTNPSAGNMSGGGGCEGGCGLAPASIRTAGVAFTFTGHRGRFNPNRGSELVLSSSSAQIPDGDQAIGLPSYTPGAAHIYTPGGPKSSQGSGAGVPGVFAIFAVTAPWQRAGVALPRLGHATGARRGGPSQVQEAGG
jgi:hypothetical protein